MLIMLLYLLLDLRDFHHFPFFQNHRFFSCSFRIFFRFILYAFGQTMTQLSFRYIGIAFRIEFSLQTPSMTINISTTPITVLYFHCTKKLGKKKEKYKITKRVWFALLPMHHEQHINHFYTIAPNHHSLHIFQTYAFTIYEILIFHIMESMFGINSIRTSNTEKFFPFEMAFVLSFSFISHSYSSEHFSNHFVL